MNVNEITALVTGGASGLGWATAQRLLKEGARVVSLDLPASVERIRLAVGVDGAEYVAGDITDTNAVQAAVDIANERGDLAVLVNCAGIGDPRLVVGKDGPQELERFERVVRVNLIGTFNVTRLAAHAMIQNQVADRERGIIVNTASVAAYEGQVGQSSYAASKAAIVGLTLPMAREFARHGIRVNTIAPGLFETPLLGELPQEVRDGLGAQVPYPSRLGRPEEYADLVVAIVGNEMLNGETIRLDGAIRMAPR